MSPRLPSPLRLHAGLLAALAAVAGCRGCGERQQPVPRAAPPPVSSVPAELATLELPDLQAAPGEVQQVEGFVNALGTGGAFVIRTAKGALLIHGRKAYGTYPSILQVAISPDGRSVAFAAGDSASARVVQDGRAGPAYEVVERLVFTRRGRLGYVAHASNRWRVVVDGIPGKECDTIADLRPDPDGTSLVSVEQAAPGSPFSIVRYGPGTERRVVRELEAAEALLDPGGRRVAAVTGAPGRKTVAVVDLREGAGASEGPPHEDVLALAFDPTGTRLAYAALRGTDTLLAVDSMVEPLPSGKIASHLVVTARASVGVVIAGEKQRLHVAFDRPPREARAYEVVSEVTASPDGSRWAYVAEEKGRGRVVVDGQEGPLFDRVVGVRFSPDGSLLAYRARQDGRRFVVVADADGKILQRHPDYEQVFPVAFTPDGASVAYAVKEGPRLLWKVEKLPPAR